MRVLGIDPGLVKTGWAVIHDHQAEPGPGSFDAAVIVRAAGDGASHETWTRLLFHQLLEIARDSKADLVALEDFVHRGWQGRRISTEADMGKLVGGLKAMLEHEGFKVTLVDSGESKTNMELAKKWFTPDRGDHKYSAYCAAFYAAGAKRPKPSEPKERKGPVPRVKKQEALPEMPEGAGQYAGVDIEELRLGLMSGSNLKVAQRIEPGDEVEITIRGRFTKTEHSIKTRGRRQGGGQYAQQRDFVRVTEVVKIESFASAAPGDE